FRTLLFVPLMREARCIGVFALTRNRVDAFSPKQVELVQTFADQAVIAIENVRLFDEVQARTRDLSESLQQQTATAGVLKGISRSAFDLDIVMNTLAKSARDLCASTTASLFLRDGEVLLCRGVAAIEDSIAAFIKNSPVPVDTASHMGRALLTGTIINVEDFD